MEQTRHDQLVIKVHVITSAVYCSPPVTVSYMKGNRRGVRGRKECKEA